MTTLDRSRTAVLVMDFQTTILAMLGDATPTLLGPSAAVVAAARVAKLPVIYVVVGFRPGYPEANPKNASFAAVAESGRFVTDVPGSDVHEALKPHPHDVIVTKHRVSAFAGTDLDMILRAKSIDTLVLLGISTSGVVLSTVRHGADADYRMFVVADGCADRDPEVHRVLLDKVLARQATVLPSAEIIAAFG